MILLSILLFFIVFCMFLIPALASLILYIKEKRFVVFNVLVSGKAPQSLLESKLIKICIGFESFSKLCVFLFVILAILSILNR